jgi:hypothetical protein
MGWSDWVHVHEIAVMFGWPRDPSAKLAAASPGAVLAVPKSRRYKRGNFPQTLSDRIKSWRLSAPFRSSSPTRPRAI